MSSIDSSAVSAQISNQVQASVLKLALDSQQSAAAQLIGALQPPAQPAGGSGRLVDVYA
jgi:hypothetical protein